MPKLPKYHYICQTRHRVMPIERLSAHHECTDEPSSQGLSLNRSQYGDCSTNYNTPAGKKVVYDWSDAQELEMSKLWL